MTTTLPSGARAAETAIADADSRRCGSIGASGGTSQSDWAAIRAGLADLRARLIAHRAAVGSACAWLALLAFVTAAIGYRPVSRLVDNVMVTWAAIWTGVGVALVGAAIALHPCGGARPRLDAPAVTGRARPSLLAAGLLLLALGTEVSAGLTGMAWARQVGPTGQFALLFGGLMSFALGLIGARGWRMPRIHWPDVLIVGAIIVGGLILRAGGLGDYIRHPVDEVHFSTGVETFFFDNRRVDLLTTESAYLPATMLYSYWNAGTVVLFGWNWTGLRMTSAILGAVTVLAVYGAVYALFDRRAAVAAAIVAATFPPHLHFSRLAMGQLGDALFGMMLILFIARGLRWNRRADWVWAGVSLGLTQYFYEGGRYAFPALALGFFLWSGIGALLAVVQRGGGPHGSLRPYLKGWWLLLIAALVTAAPMYIAMAAIGAPFGARMSSSSISPQYLIDGLTGQLDPHQMMWFRLRITDPFLIYTFNPDVSGMWYSRFSAMVLQPIIPLFLFGVGQAVWRGRSAAVMLVFLLLIVSAGNILMTDTLWYTRYIMTMPAVAALIGVGIALTWPLLWPGTGTTRPRWLRQAISLAPVGLALVVAGIQVNYYFTDFMRQYHTPMTGAQRYRDSSDAVQRLIALPQIGWQELILLDDDDGDVFLPRQVHSFLTERRPLAYSIQMYNTRRLPITFFRALPRDRSYVFAVEPWDAVTMARLRAVFTTAAPTYSPGRFIHPAREYVLFYAPLAWNRPPLHDAAPGDGRIWMERD